MEMQELDKLTENFRIALRDFYKVKGYHENVKLQDYATQLYWHIMELQHRRLEKKDIQLDFTSLRQNYTKTGSIEYKSFFDGKYEITNATEQIESTCYYTSHGARVYKRRSDLLAHYTVLNAKAQGENQILCPNCGNVTTRENLLDGCDYCHSKFTIEDLGARVSNFALRSDPDIVEAKYANNKELLTGWMKIAIAAVSCVVGFVVSIIVLPFVSMAFWMKACASLALMGLCYSAIMSYINGMLNTREGKLLQALGKGLYEDQEMSEVKQEQDYISPRTASQVIQVDPLFSLQGFLSNVQNKLMVIMYAETPKQINALANCDLSRYLPDYKDVFEADAEKMVFTRYRSVEGLQHATVEATLGLVLKNCARHVVERRDRVEVELVKSAACKTQAVRGPEVFICKCCGASLSLFEGKGCAYCGQELNLSDYDWEIEAFRVQESRVLQTLV